MNKEEKEKHYEIKIFEIDSTCHLLKGKHRSKDIVQHIVDHHRSRIKDTENRGKPLIPVEIGPVTYYSYLNEEPVKIAHWKKFLPSSITNLHEFKIKALTYTLFACIEDKIFAIIGGNGAMVLKKFQNHRYGLELFEYITDLNEDIVSVTTRGISGNLTLNSSTFRDGQKLLDTLNFTNIPSKIVLVLKEELKNSPFDFIDFGSKKIYLEISSYFNIKHKINFQELHQIFIALNEIPKISERKSLTSFIQIKDRAKIDEFEKILFEKIRDDSINRYGPARPSNLGKLDIDFIHPSKIQEFYEADFFEIKAKRAKKGIIITERSKLYQEGLRFIYEKTSHMNQFEFNQFIAGLKVLTWKGETKYPAMFWHYLTCEISYENKPVFHIDGNWYSVVDNFSKSMNAVCTQAIEQNYLTEEILFKGWHKEIKDEDEFNSQYRGEEGYTVFDKSLGQKIELCDIMYEDGNNLYLIHVKAGFDAKMRDLSNQIIISANRLMNDRNSGSALFIGEVIDNYNRRKDNEEHQINKEEYVQKFKSGFKNIIFVLAFKPEQKRIKNIRNNVEKVNSNIAKFSLIQCVREMNSLSYPIKIVEIGKTA